MERRSPGAAEPPQVTHLGLGVQTRGTFQVSLQVAEAGLWRARVSKNQPREPERTPPWRVLRKVVRGTQATLHHICKMASSPAELGVPPHRMKGALRGHFLKEAGVPTQVSRGRGRARLLTAGTMVRGSICSSRAPATQRVPDGLCVGRGVCRQKTEHCVGLCPLYSCSSPGAPRPAPTLGWREGSLAKRVGMQGLLGEFSCLHTQGSHP